MKRKSKKLSDQVKSHSEKEMPKSGEHTGDINQMRSTGSTLLDLAISGGRIRGGGIPSGIFVEIFGPSSAGKTVLLCEIAGDVQRRGGQVRFYDPEARLNQQFAKIFDFDVDVVEYETPDTVPEIFIPIRTWQPKPDTTVHGVFADSLAALSTDMEMDDKDKYGMRRAKEFSEELRKTCRTLKNQNFLMVASNQIRQNVDGGPWSEKWKSPGGSALEFYSSLRLKMYSGTPIKEEVKVGRKTIKQPVGIQTRVQIYKSSIWKPYREADITILFDYGIDDIRENLQFVKDVTKENVYTVNGKKMGQAMDKAIHRVEKNGLEQDLREQVIDLWEDVEQKFEQKRKPKER